MFFIVSISDTPVRITYDVFSLLQVIYYAFLLLFVKNGRLRNSSVLSEWKSLSN